MDIPEGEAQALAGQPYHHHEVLSELPLAYTMDETHYAVAGEFLKEGSAQLLAPYFRGIDIVSHSAMRYSNLYDAPSATPEERRRYGEVVSRYYRYTFSRLRGLIEAAGDDTIVLLVSDHGFEPVGGGDYNHPNAPDGVIFAMGGGEATPPDSFHPGVYDVVPTVLWLMGYPSAKDMPGRPLVELFPQLRASRDETQLCTTYGSRVPISPGAADRASQSDAEQLELLRGLGYIE